MLNPFDSFFWLQFDLVKVRSEVSDRTWAKMICDQRTDSSGFGLSRSGPQHDLTGVFGIGVYVTPTMVGDETLPCVMRLKAYPG